MISQYYFYALKHSIITIKLLSFNKTNHFDNVGLTGLEIATTIVASGEATNL